MALPLDPKEGASLEETGRMEMIISQALINVLVQKAIVTEAGIIKEVKSLKASLPKGE